MAVLLLFWLHVFGREETRRTVQDAEKQRATEMEGRAKQEKVSQSVSLFVTSLLVRLRERRGRAAQAEWGLKEGFILGAPFGGGLAELAAVHSAMVLWIMCAATIVAW